MVLATPVIAIIDLIERLGPALPSRDSADRCGQHEGRDRRARSESFRENAAQQFLAGHPMAGKEQSGVDFADADLFQGAAWFVTPFPEQDVYAG